MFNLTSFMNAGIIITQIFLLFVIILTLSFQAQFQVLNGFTAYLCINCTPVCPSIPSVSQKTAAITFCLKACLDVYGQRDGFTFAGRVPLINPSYLQPQLTEKKLVSSCKAVKFSCEISFFVCFCSGASNLDCTHFSCPNHHTKFFTYLFHS